VKYTTSIFRDKDGSSMFFLNVVSAYKFTRRSNPEEHHQRTNSLFYERDLLVENSPLSEDPLNNRWRIYGPVRK
jgi:hypothetical protein